MSADKSAIDLSSIAAGSERIEISEDELLSADRQVSQLLGLLAALRDELTDGVMPRAARITGTSERLASAVDHVDAAIRVAKSVRHRIAGTDLTRGCAPPAPSPGKQAALGG